MDKKNLMTIKEFAEKASELSRSKLSTDKRYSSEISERRIKDYISKGLLDKPYKDGKTALFGQDHLNKLLIIRDLQSDGLTEQNIKKLSENYSTTNNFSQQDVSDEALRLNAIACINSIQSDNLIKNNLELSGQSALKTIEQYYQNTDNPKSINTLSQSSKIWQEIPLDEEGKLFLKMEYGSLPKNSQKIIEKMKTILNIK